MRKALLIMGLAVTMFAVGCSDNGSNNGGSGDGSGKTGTTLVEEAEVDEYGWEEVVPKYDDIFVSGECGILENSEKQYYIYVSGCTKDEFNKYVDLVKTSGYNKETYKNEDGENNGILYYLESAKYHVDLGFYYNDDYARYDAYLVFKHLKND